MNPRLKRHLLFGVVGVWAFLALVGLLVGLLVFTFNHPYIGGPLAVTLVGVLLGWLAYDVNEGYE